MNSLNTPPNITGDDAVLLDTELAYNFDNGTTFALGVNNLTVIKSHSNVRTSHFTSPHGFNSASCMRKFLIVFNSIKL